MNKDIQKYNDSQLNSDREVCNTLASIISENLPEAENKVWHAHPVWFIEGNPIVGYSKLKSGLRLMFWSGQSFDEKGLEKEGSFKAATKSYNSTEDIDVEELKKWLKKSKTIQWNYKNIVKRKGELIRLK